jgi:hypothetical protein
MALSCLNNLTVPTNIIKDIIRVGSEYNIILGLIFGDEAIFTIITVGMKLKTPWKLDLINRGTKRMKVAKTKSRVIAELASLVLSTNMDMSIPNPIKPKPRKNKTKIINMGL